MNPSRVLSSKNFSVNAYFQFRFLHLQESQGAILSHFLSEEEICSQVCTRRMLSTPVEWFRNSCNLNALSQLVLTSDGIIQKELWRKKQI